MERWRMNAACGLYEEATILTIKLLKTLIGMSLNTSDKLFIGFRKGLHILSHSQQVIDKAHKVGGQLCGKMR